MEIKIVSYWDSSKIILCGEYESIKDCLQKNRDKSFQGAYLQGADLQGAYLQGADLQGADLQGADLQGAYLRGAYLRGAYLQGADLQGADDDKIKVTSNNVLFFSGFGSNERTTTAFQTDKGIFIQCGCWSGSMKEFKARIKETHKNSNFAKEYLLICKLIELRF